MATGIGVVPAAELVARAATARVIAKSVIQLVAGFPSVSAARRHMRTMLCPDSPGVNGATLSAKSCCEPRVVADRGEVVVARSLLAERREQLDRSLEVVERLVARVSRERREARVVVVQAAVFGHLLEAGAYLFERVVVALLAV